MNSYSNDSFILHIILGYFFTFMTQKLILLLYYFLFYMKVFFNMFLLHFCISFFKCLLCECCFTRYPCRPSEMFIKNKKIKNFLYLDNQKKNEIKNFNIYCVKIIYINFYVALFSSKRELRA